MRSLALEQGRDAVFSGLANYDCIERSVFTAASGIEANLKYNLEKIAEDSPEFAMIVRALAAICERAQPDLLSAVPNGANRWGEPVASELGVPFARFMAKNGNYMVGTKAWSHDIREAFTEAKRIIVTEDVISTRVSTLKYAQFIGIDRVIGAVAILDRGEDVMGIRTPEQSFEYMFTSNGKAVPAHVTVPFRVESLVNLPTAMMVAESGGYYED